MTFLTLHRLSSVVPESSSSSSSGSTTPSVEVQMLQYSLKGEIKAIITDVKVATGDVTVRFSPVSQSSSCIVFLCIVCASMFFLLFVVS
jgi:hypothetical protein